MKGRRGEFIFFDDFFYLYGYKAKLLFDFFLEEKYLSILAVKRIGLKSVATLKI